MKATIKMMIAALLLLAACQSKNSQTQNFIPGTYVNAAKGEYAIANDTLVIKQADGDNYQITRRTTYQAIRDGKLLAKHSKVQNLNAVCDSGKQELDELITGRVFRFDADKKQLLINQAVYRKLN
jgi:major membrane immunogen (membrane-anchored lipoprotein)